MQRPSLVRVVGCLVVALVAVVACDGQAQDRGGAPNGGGTASTWVAGGPNDAIGRCAEQPGLCGYPDESTTGPRREGQLRRIDGDVRTQREGQQLKDLDVRGTVHIDHSGVELLNTRVTASGESAWGVIIGRRRAVRDVVLRDCLIDAGGSSQGGVVGESTSRWTIERCEVTNGENAIRAHGHALIVENYVHDLDSTASSPHYDAVEIYAGDDNAVLGNTLLVGEGATSAVNVQATFGDIARTRVEGNLFDGGGWQVNIRSLDGPVTRTILLDNRFGLRCAWGRAAVDEGTTEVVEGNTRDLTGDGVDDALDVPCGAG